MKYLSVCPFGVGTHGVLLVFYCGVENSERALKYTVDAGFLSAPRI